jgi:hypothetical protein
MATIIFSDGRRATVEYAQAVDIHNVLTGVSEPKNDEQAKFVEGVHSVIFEHLPPKNAAATKAAPRKVWHGPDQKMRQILEDKSLRGIEKVKAVSKRLMERTQE